MVTNIIDEFHSLKISKKNSQIKLEQLAEKQFQKLLIQHFKVKEQEYILTKKDDSQSSVYAAIKTFRNRNNLDKLLESLQLIVSSFQNEIQEENKCLQFEETKEQVEEQKEDKQSQNESRDKMINLIPDSPVQRNIERPSHKNLYLKLKKRASVGKPMIKLRKSEMCNLSDDEVQELSYEINTNSLFESPKPSPSPKSTTKNYFVEEFYRNQSDMKNSFAQILTFAHIDFTPEEIIHFKSLFEKQYYQLFDIIKSYKINNDYPVIKDVLKELLLIDIELLSNHSKKITQSKMRQYYSFQKIMMKLYDNKQITENHYKLIMYLYTKESLPLLSVYEVYLATQDEEEFLDSLFEIEKIEFFNQVIKIDDFNEYDKKFEDQIRILFAFKTQIGSKQRKTLEKLIKLGDQQVIKLNIQLKQSKITKKQFIEKLITLADQKASEFKKYKEIIKNPEYISKEKQQDRLFLFKHLQSSKNIKGIKDIKFPFLVEDLINDNNQEIIAAYEVFDLTGDKLDLVENLSLLYKKAFGNVIKEIIKKHETFQSQQQRKILKVDKILRINEAFTMLQSVYEVFRILNDEKDFYSSINHVLKKHLPGSV